MCEARVCPVAGHLCRDDKRIHSLLLLLLLLLFPTCNEAQGVAVVGVKVRGHCAAALVAEVVGHEAPLLRVSSLLREFIFQQQNQQPLSCNLGDLQRRSQSSEAAPDWCVWGPT